MPPRVRGQQRLARTSGARAVVAAARRVLQPPRLWTVRLAALAVRCRAVPVEVAARAVQTRRSFAALSKEAARSVVEAEQLLGRSSWTAQRVEMARRGKRRPRRH